MEKLIGTRRRKEMCLGGKKKSAKTLGCQTEFSAWP